MKIVMKEIGHILDSEGVTQAVQMKFESYDGNQFLNSTVVIERGEDDLDAMTRKQHEVLGRQKMVDWILNGEDKPVEESGIAVQEEPEEIPLPEPIPEPEREV